LKRRNRTHFSISFKEFFFSQRAQTHSKSSRCADVLANAKLIIVFDKSLRYLVFQWGNSTNIKHKKAVQSKSFDLDDNASRLFPEKNSLHELNENGFIMIFNDLLEDVKK